MANDDDIDARGRLVELLLNKIAEDVYPSGTMMDLLEELLLPDEVGAYATVLMEKLREDAFPSVPMMRRLVELTQPG